VSYRGGLRGEAGLNRLEEVPIEDRGMLARIALPTMIDLSEIRPVLQEIGQWAFSEGNAADDLARAQTPLAGDDSPLVELPHEDEHRARGQITIKDQAHRCGLILIDNELAVYNAIAQRYDAAYPYALLLGGGDLVADALAGHLVRTERRRATC